MLSTTAEQWQSAQYYEKLWWDDCVNTYQEEKKQLEFVAPNLGLTAINHDGHWPAYDLSKHSIIDVGGGPVSILLKCFNSGARTVIDPCLYPSWIAERYAAAGITFLRRCAEDFLDLQADEVWIYNTLQHVKDPQQIAINTRNWGKLVRVVEFINVPTDEKHPHLLTASELDNWFGDHGRVEENIAFGARVYIGNFPQSLTKDIDKSGKI